MEWDRDRLRDAQWTSVRDFGAMLRARRKELGWTQKQVADELRIEGKPIPQSRVADHERGMAPVKPEVVEEFARVLRMSRNLLYLAARMVPPEVAAELRRLTPEERELAWRAFTQVVEQSQKRRTAAEARETGEARPTDEVKGRTRT